MASRPRSHAEQGGGRVGEERVQDILSICPATLGSGLQALLSESESSGRLRVQAVARIKALLEQVKANIKVCAGRNNRYRCLQREFEGGATTAGDWLLLAAVNAMCVPASLMQNAIEFCHLNNGIKLVQQQRQRPRSSVLTTIALDPIGFSEQDLTV